MREYEPIWTMLKKHGTVSVTANRLVHPRIVKAVTKEKWLDIAYKLDIDPKIAWLSHTSQNSILTFRLEAKFRIDRRTRGELTSKDFGF